ncbi:MAG: hypothetical protein HYZ42_05140, partial [Bacteroidetes bacterium]|nr:hypothetical protein [Bacteroidota bacterium]
MQAQRRALSTEELKKLELIRDIEQYAKVTLKLKLKPDFYTLWEKQDSMTVYLYVSRTDSVLPIKGLSTYIYFGTNYKAADSAKHRYDSMKYETVLYKTAGNSGCRLTTRFLQYPPHALAFICFHELYHRHKQASKSKLPYSFEEATCDVLGNYATLDFFKEYSKTNSEYTPYIDSVILQTQVNESFYQLLMSYTKPETN